MKKLLLTLALLLLPSVAFAQCNGIFQNNTACGNVSGGPAPPSSIPLSSFPAAAPGGTSGQLQYDNSGAFGGATGGCSVNSNGIVVCAPAQAAKTANYPVVNTDCNTTIPLGTGSTAQLTLTLPALPSAGFGPGCLIWAKNNDVYSGIGTGHAMTIAGAPADLIGGCGGYCLWPGQAIAFTPNSAGTAWLTVYNPGRWQLPASAEICLTQNGSNSNDGLGAGTGCMSDFQTALLVIGQQWDGGGYQSCSLGFYVGGTSTFGAANQTGQSVGCFITINIRGAVTFTAAGACIVGGDNSITILNWNLGSIPTFKCNTANTASTGQIKCHQYCVFDINGGTAIWLPGGNNDVFFDLDLQGSATLAAQVNVGDGVNTYAPLAWIHCESHCSKVTDSSTLAFSAHVTMTVVYALNSGSVITVGASFPGVTATNPSTPTGNSVLITNGITIPGGTSSGTGGQVCATLC